MLKSFLLSLSLLLSTQINAYASETQLCNFARKFGFAGMAQKMGSKDDDPLIKKVSEDYRIRLEHSCTEEHGVGVIDTGACSSSCVRHGNSELRVKTAIVTRGLTGLSAKTQECQKICHIYSVVLGSFLDGLSEGSSNSTNCSDNVSSSERSSNKSTLGEKSLPKEKIKPTSVTKQ